MKAVSYSRVSTAAQGATGYGLDAQRKAIREFCKANGFEILKSFKDVESGKNNDRKGLKDAIAYAKEHGAYVVVAKIDRLSRKLSFVAKLLEDGVPFISVELGTKVDPFLIQLWASVAEMEARKISERTKAGLAAAKARGVKLGNPQGAKSLKKARKAYSEGADEFAESMGPIVEKLKAAGFGTYAGLALQLNQLGYPARRGGTWAPTQIMHLLNRLYRLDRERAARRLEGKKKSRKD